jgi:predicted ester cyclase
MSTRNQTLKGESRIRSVGAKPDSQLELAEADNPLLELIERGFNQGDFSVLEEVLDPDFVERQRLPPGVPPNAAAVRGIIRSLRTAFPDLHLSTESMDRAGDKIWALFRATGTNQGPFMGHPPTGRRLSITVMDMVRVKGGRIVEHWGVPDLLAALEELGLLPGD